MLSKKKLAIVLSKLKQFDNPKVILEQYSTDSEVAAEILWKAYMNGDIEGKIIADLGCGPGIFGIGAALLGAKKVFFIDKDQSAIDTTELNVIDVGIENCVLDVKKIDVSDFKKKVDVVLMNPPFGTKVKHHDKVFLKKAMQVSKIIYSIHKITSKKFIEEFSKDNGFKVDYVIPFDLRLRKAMKHHKKPAVFVNVGLWRLSSH